MKILKIKLKQCKEKIPSWPDGDQILWWSDGGLLYVLHHRLCIRQESPYNGLSGPKNVVSFSLKNVFI
jgi:hypothetical protein